MGAGLMITRLSPSLVMIAFPSAADVEKVLSKGQWKMGDHDLNFISHGFTPDEEQSRWIQILPSMATTT